MDRVTRYILGNFAPLFLSLFFTLFFLVSVIFFITIARLTALISVSFWDLGEIFLYSVPEMFGYTMPVTFFIAVAMTMFQMSRENEVIVLFALSLNPKKIAKPFSVIAALLSLFLLFNALVLVPLSRQMSKNFIEMKKMEAKLNLKESEFGQKFSDWHVFVRSSDRRNFHDIVLYQKGKEGESDKLILAKSANLDRNASLMTLTLKEGNVYIPGSDKLTQASYARLIMNYNPKLHELHSSDIYDYWMEAKSDPKRAQQLSFTVLVSLFPLLGFLFALSFGIAHMRYQKPNIYLNSMIVILLFYIAIYQVSHKAPLYGSMGVVILFGTLSWIWFKKRVMERF
ncbi:MAG TPA: LptF/LptG family permease [Campylobacteraceae bacterium]|nr:LptF/LptG family permease [Campylobacteraceae bacterium]